MKQNGTLVFALLLIISTLCGCQAIADIFKAGFWTAIIVVVLVVGIILWIISKARK